MGLAILGLALSQPATDARWDAFVEACVPHRRDIVRAAGALAAAGWIEVPEDDHPELAASAARARAALDDPAYPMEVRSSYWRRGLEGRPLYVVLSRVDMTLNSGPDDDAGLGRSNTFALLGCGLWDFDAPGPVAEAAVTACAGAEPVQRIVSPGGLTGGTWNVHARLPGTGEIHVGWIPEGPDAADTGFSGVAITMTSAPERDEGVSD